MGYVASCSYTEYKEIGNTQNHSHMKNVKSSSTKSERAKCARSIELIKKIAKNKAKNFGRPNSKIRVH